MIEIKELSTGYIIPKVNCLKYWSLINFFTTTNVRTKEQYQFGLVEDEDSYRIGKISRDQLTQLMNGIEFSIKKLGYTDAGKLSAKMTMKNPPKNDIQEEVIQNVVNTFKEDERCIISLPTGQGKTYVATNIMSKMNTPTFVFVKSIALRDQWIKSFHTHSNLRLENIAMITGSSDLVSILESGITYDVIISTHASVQSFIKLVGMREFNRLLMIQKIGLKIFDEFDLETLSTFNIETHTSVKHTLYLSATDYKSRQEDKIFQSVYGYLNNFGKEYDIKPKRNALFIIYNSRPDRKTFGKCFSYSKDGFVFDYHKYHKYMVDHKTYVSGLKYLWDKSLKDKFYNKEQYMKTVFFIGRKTTAEEFRKSIAKIFDVDIKYISILNSDIPQKDREKNKEYKLIVSTSDSLGRGIDLKDLDVVVDLETRASFSVTTQVIGRVSRTGAKQPGLYVNFVDTAFQTVTRNFNFKVEKGLYDQLFTTMKVLKLDK